MEPQQQGAEQGEQQYAPGPGGNVVLGSIAHGQPAPGAYPSYSQQLQEQMGEFWRGQMQEVEQVSEFKSHSLPLARIKKIMKADEDVRMISGEAPVLFAKACEMFILELTLRAWNHTEENKRRTLQKNDIAAAVTRTDIFDFLVDIVPRDDIKEEGLGLARAMPIGPTPDMFHYMMPGQAGVMPRPGAPLDPAMYAQQRPLYMPQQQWSQQEQQNQQPAQESAPSGE